MLNIFYSPSFGFAPAISILICQAIPVYPISEVKKVAVITTLFAFGISFVFCGIGIIFRQPLFNAFTIIEELRTRAKDILVYTIIAGLLISSKFILVILKSLGKNIIGFLMILVHMIVLTPLFVFIFGYILKYAVKGIFMGVCVSYVASAIMYFFCLILIDFEQCQKEVRDNLRKDARAVKNFGMDEEDEKDSSGLDNTKISALPPIEDIEDDKVPLKSDN